METQNGRAMREALIRKHGKHAGTKMYYKAVNSGKLDGSHRSGAEAESRAAGRIRGANTRETVQHYKLKPKHREHISEGLKAAHRRKMTRGYNAAVHAV